MAMYTQIPFPHYEGLPWMSQPPTVDGFVEEEFPGLTADEYYIGGTHPAQPPLLEVGYTRGGRVTWGGASGQPNALFETTWDSSGGFIYLGFMSRYDPTYDDDDFVTVFLRPDTSTTKSANDRRIDVNPVQPGAGAAGVAGDPTNYDFNVGPFVRTNKTAPTTFYVRNPTNIDGSHTDQPRWNSGATQPSGFVAKCRSVTDGTNLFWSVELKIPTSKAVGGTSWIDLQTNFGIYVCIGQTTPGTPNEVVTQFPWPFDPDVPNSNILHDPLDPVANPFEQLNWDPDTLGTGVLGTTVGAVGLRFRNDAMGIGVDAGGDIPGFTVVNQIGHTNNFEAQVQNTSTETAHGVRARFRIAEFGVSGGLYGNNAAWADLPPSQYSYPEPQNPQNPAPPNGMDIPPSALPDGYTKIPFPWTVDSTWHSTLASLGSDQCLWVTLDQVGAGNAVEFLEDSVRRNLSVQTLSTVNHVAIVDPKHFPPVNLIRGTHQLIVHVASSPARAAIDTAVERVYSQGGIAERLGAGAAAAHTAPTAKPSTPVTRSPIALKTAVDAPLIHENPITSGLIARLPLPNGGGGIHPVVPKVATWHSAVNAYQLVNHHLTFKSGKRRQVAVYSGGYGYIARHVLEPGETLTNLELNHSISAPGMKALGDNTYLLSVGPSTRVQVANTLKTVRAGDIVTKPGGILTKPSGILTNPGGIVTKPVGLIGGLLNRLRPAK